MSIKSITSLVLVVLSLIAITSANIWSYCPGNVDSTFEIDTLTVTPDPPIIGKGAFVQLSGNLNQEVTEGASIFSLQYYIDGGWRNLPTFKNNVCSLLSCPVQPGPLNFNTTIKVPFITPPGQYQGTLLLTDQNNRNISCLTFQTTMGYSI
ncbi:hypothetical protein RB653_006258 [Dictyostelium firmibasis]|uniref:MD-2-related lipid-recognition domain-containing protein n=1 Tax=Dictyostelium firmibasis TaxID=79012 RepID=A0AAN7UMD7_9MYCE